MSAGYFACRDALHTLLEGVTGYLTTANVANNDHTLLDKGLNYAAVLSRGQMQAQSSPAGFSDRYYEVLVECFVRYTNENATAAALEQMIDAMTSLIDQNPTLKNAKGVIGDGTLVTGADEPVNILMRGASANAPPVFMMCVLHVQIEYRYKITGGEFR